MALPPRFRALLVAPCLVLLSCDAGSALPTELLDEDFIANLAVAREQLTLAPTASFIALSGPIGTALAVAGPASGQTFVWDAAQLRYVPSARTGAPAAGYRFVLYAAASGTVLPSLPLQETGSVDITATGTIANPSALVVVRNAAAAAVLRYTASRGTSPTGASMGATGTAGTGADSVVFTLAVAPDTIPGAVSSVWLVEQPGSRLSSRTQTSVGDTAWAFRGFARRLVYEIDMRGTLDESSGGPVSVAVGGREFASLTVTPDLSAFPQSVDGEPLTPREEQILVWMFEWFAEGIRWRRATLGAVEPIVGRAP